MTTMIDSTTHAPDALVRQVIGRLLDAGADAGAGIQAAPAAAMFRQVREHFLPYTNWAYATRVSAGRYWRLAPPDRRLVIEDEYRQLMLLTVSEALLPLRGGRLEVESVAGGVDAVDVVVRTRIAPVRGEPVALDYRLERVSGMWRIYDVHLGGQWFIVTHQPMFANGMQQGGCDMLIAMLRTEKQRVAARLELLSG